MGEGSDQLLGRLLSGLPITTVDFSILPPHFPLSSPIPESVFVDCIASYGRLPNCFKSCLPYLFASLAYHMDWLKAELQPNHALFTSPVWTSGILQSWKGRVVIERSVSVAGGLHATGVPTALTTALVHCISERLS